MGHTRTRAVSLVLFFSFLHGLKFFTKKHRRGFCSQVRVLPSLHAGNERKCIYRLCPPVIEKATEEFRGFKCVEHSRKTERECCDTLGCFLSRLRSYGGPCNLEKSKLLNALFRWCRSTFCLGSWDETDRQHSFSVFCGLVGLTQEYKPDYTSKPGELHSLQYRQYYVGYSLCRYFSHVWGLSGVCSVWFRCSCYRICCPQASQRIAHSFSRVSLRVVES